jgi:hypothetical protein
MCYIREFEGESRDSICQEEKVGGTLSWGREGEFKTHFFFNLPV